MIYYSIAKDVRIDELYAKRYKNMVNEENEKLFDSIKEETPTGEESNLIQDVDTEEVDTSVKDEQFVVKVSSKSAQEIETEKGRKENCDGRTLTIKSVNIKAPVTKKLKEGLVVDVEPTKTLSGFSKYDSKLIIRFAEENLIEYVPGINFFLRADGSINNNVRLNRKGENGVSKLVRLVLAKMITESKSKLTESEFSKSTSDQAILDFLVGRKVLISTTKGVYKGKSWFRNDVKEIL